MWMAYVQDVEIVDLKSGIEHLSQLFSNLEFDAAHEAVYGLGRIHSPEYCNHLADQYMKAEALCDDYLEGKSSIDTLVHGIINLNFTGYLHRIKQYLSPNLVNTILESQASDDVDEVLGETEQEVVENYDMVDN